MNRPEQALAVLSFAPIEFEVVKAAAEDLRHLPDGYTERMRSHEASIQLTQRGWLGMSEQAIREDAERRKAQEKSVIHHNRTVVESQGVRKIHAHLASEHPVITAATKVIKFGPPVVRVLGGCEQYYRLMGYSDEVIARMKEGLPEDALAESYDRDIEEIEDLSEGTGLLMRGINVKTGRAALGAYNLPPLAEDGPGFDIGFTMNPSLQKQEVDVIIFERDGDNASGMANFLLEQLPHLRTID